MKCPKCGADNNCVIDTRDKETYHLRRRRCGECNTVFKTYEYFVPERVTTRPMPEWAKRKESKNGRNDV